MLLLLTVCLETTFNLGFIDIVFAVYLPNSKLNL